MPQLTPQHHRARVANAVRRGDQDTAAKARRDLKAAMATAYIEDWIETWAPTPEQVSIIAAILNPEGGSGE